MALRSQWIVAQIDQLQGVRIDHSLVSVHLDNVVVVGQQLLQFRHLEHNLWQGYERIVGDVQATQARQFSQLVGQFGHLVVRQVKNYKVRGEDIFNLRAFIAKLHALLTCNQTEFGGEFRRNLGNDVAAQVTSLQLGVPHQMINCIWYLHQLTLGQICREKREFSVKLGF